jgi:hypothetical protein
LEVLKDPEGGAEAEAASLEVRSHLQVYSRRPVQAWPAASTPLPLIRPMTHLWRFLFVQMRMSYCERSVGWDTKQDLILSLSESDSIARSRSPSSEPARDRTPR